VPCGNSVNGVGIVRYPDAVPGQLVTESYRPRAGGRRRHGQRRDTLLELLGATDERLPEAIPALRIEGGKDLAAAGVKEGEAPAVSGSGRLPHRPPDRVEGADAGHRQAKADAEPTGGGDGDPQAGEGAGAETDREQVDALPAPSRSGTVLDLPQQRRRVPGPLVGGAQQ
jgi:hypothetical protein